MQDFAFEQKEPYSVYRKDEQRVEPNAFQMTMQDLEYFKGLYPGGVRSLQVRVDEACDRMEYPNSPMYDEFPDRLLINQMTDKIHKAVMEEMEQAETTSGPQVREIEEVEVYELNNFGRPPQGPPPWGPPPGTRPPWGPPPGPRPPQGPPPWGPPPGPRPPQGPPPWGPPPGPRPPWGPPPPPRPPHGGNNWLSDMIQVLLLNEMQRRRCCGRR